MKMLIMMIGQSPWMKPPDLMQCNAMQTLFWISYDNDYDDDDLITAIVIKLCAHFIDLKLMIEGTMVWIRTFWSLSTNIFWVKIFLSVAVWWVSMSNVGFFLPDHGKLWGFSPTLCHIFMPSFMKAHILSEVWKIISALFYKRSYFMKLYSFQKLFPPG